MKIIHTADWHLGDNFHGFDRIAEHHHFLNWLQQLIADEQPDALLVAGDIFDNANPSAQAEEMLYNFLAQVTRNHPNLKVILTAGNHDSGRRLQAPAELLRNFGVEVRGVVQQDQKSLPILDDLIIPVCSANNPDDKAVILAVPYLRSGDYEPKGSLTQSVREFFGQLAKMARKEHGKEVPLVLMAHLYAAGSEIATNEHSERLVVGGEDCIDVKGLDHEVAYVALGHIHKAQQVGGDESMAFYAGSPVPMSFAEKNYTHSVNKVILGVSGGIMLDQIEYTPLRRLQSIPANGAAPLDQVLQQIKDLPKASKLDSDEWPYLEIQLKEDHPDATVQSQILGALQDKAARLCRIVRVNTTDKKTDKKRKMQSLDQLRNISPLDIAHDAYLQRTGKELSDQLMDRFKKAEKKAKQILTNNPDNK